METGWKIELMWHQFNQQVKGYNHIVLCFMSFYAGNLPHDHLGVAYYAGDDVLVLQWPSKSHVRATISINQNWCMLPVFNWQVKWPLLWTGEICTLCLLHLDNVHFFVRVNHCLIFEISAKFMAFLFWRKLEMPCCTSKGIQMSKSDVGVHE